ncbi:MAG: hypothetical protein JWL86_2124 [Rhizobium sp.]|nr:hypothetical protein [Rhizobium sp.]
MTNASNGWPDLSGPEMQPTIETLHLWSQVAGKIRLMMTPWINHGWHVPLYVSASGLTTGLIPTVKGAFSLEFDFISAQLVVRDTDGKYGNVPLRPQSVAQFYAATLEILGALGVEVQLDPMPCEIEDALKFHDDHVVRSFDAEAARAYWRALVRTHRVLQVFRSRFLGKCSPIHLFWGSFDLAVTRFSGRPAPRHPGGAVHMPDAVAREAYSQEVSSAGFWPGSGKVERPSFYSYAYPAPAGFADASVQPQAAFFDRDLGEFLPPYDAVVASPDPDGDLLSFLQSTYDAAADLAHWDRQSLEGPTGSLGKPPSGA